MNESHMFKDSVGFTTENMQTPPTDQIAHLSYHLRNRPDEHSAAGADVEAEQKA